MDHIRHIKPDKSIKDYLIEFIQYRHLVLPLITKQIKLKYKRTYLGLAWIFVQPLLMPILFYSFLGGAIGVDDYYIFLLSGFMIWQLFSTAFGYAASSLTNHADLIQKVYLPRVLLPVSMALAALFDFVLLSIAFVLYLLIAGYEVDWIVWIWAAPTATLIAMLYAIGGDVFLHLSASEPKTYSWHSPLSFKS